MADQVAAALDRALALDANDPMGRFRARFYLPDERIYLDGNSLGLLSRDAEAEIGRVVEQWKTLGIAGWLEADPPWFTLGEELGAAMAPLMGAEPAAVVVTGSTTVNLHALAATFYRPEGGRRRIVATALDFPSDIYAMASQIALHGGDPARDLVLVPSRDGRTIAEQDIIAALDDTVAMALLPVVMYRSGQMLDVGRLAAEGRERGIVMGFDAAHSAGSVPHLLDDWGVDFAVWCTYKHLNAGPGAIGALYVNRRHWGAAPSLAGWWGYDKDRQFDMAFDWRGGEGAGAWQISTPSLLSAAPLRASLAMVKEAGGIGAVRTRSLALTDFLIETMERAGLTGPDYGFSIGTPLAHGQRGGHVAIEHQDADRVAKALKARGVIPDFRKPNVIRLAPVALYNSFADIAQSVGHLRGIIDGGEHLALQAGRERVA
ncbi:MAG: kynureninase [Thermomicrobiales bacterium]